MMMLCLYSYFVLKERWLVFGLVFTNTIFISCLLFCTCITQYLPCVELEASTCVFEKKRCEFCALILKFHETSKIMSESADFGLGGDAFYGYQS